MTDETYVTRIVKKLIRYQDTLMDEPEAKVRAREGDGRVTLLRVTGENGADLLLKAEDGRVGYADERQPKDHIIKCSEDTFLNLLTREMSMREAIARNHLVIEDARDGRINLAEMKKWGDAFNNLSGLLDRLTNRL